MDDTQPHFPRSHSARGIARTPSRRRESWRRRLLVVVGVLLALALVGGAVLWGRLASFNDAVSTAPALSSRLMDLLRGTERVNILLLGHSPEGRDGAFLTDSIAVMSIDPQAARTTMVSIPRDLWVEGSADIPGNGKINEAFAIGYREGGYSAAGAGAARVAAHVTGLEIDGWLALDFDGFRHMVDAVGGVTISNPTAFAWALGPEQHEAGVWGGEYPAGKVTLEGYDALQYSRVRYTSVAAESSDFARSQRQQRLLAAVRDRVDVSVGGLQRGLALLDALGGDRFHTDLSVIDLMLLAPHLEAEDRVVLGEGVILEATRNTAGQYVLVVIGRASPDDMTPLRSFIQSALRTAASGE